MDKIQIEKLVDEYFGKLPPKEKEFIILSVQKELDMHMFNIVRELKDKYQVSKSKDNPFLRRHHKDTNC